MKKLIFIILLILCICTIPFLSYKDCSHPIIKTCVVGEFKRERVHIVGRRFWHLPVFFCRTYLVDRNSCYWNNIERKRLTNNSK